MADIDAGESDNTCPICLDPLTSMAIGACVPCGHVIHEECFKPWAERSRNRHPKCPLCNSATTSFCKIYLDLDAIAERSKGITNEELDELSLSSDVDQHVPSSSETSNNPLYRIEKQNGTNKEVIVLDDDSVTPADPPRKKRSNKALIRKYKRLATSLKRKREELRAQYQDHEDRVTNLRKTVRCLQKDANDLNGEIEDLDGARVELNLDFHGFVMERNRVKRSFNEARHKLSKCSAQNELEEREITAKIQQERQKFERKKLGPEEAREIMSTFSKLQQENRRLKASGLSLSEENTNATPANQKPKPHVPRSMKNDLKKLAMQTAGSKKATKSTKPVVQNPYATLSTHAARFGRVHSRTGRNNGTDKVTAVLDTAATASNPDASSQNQRHQALVRKLATTIRKGVPMA